MSLAIRSFPMIAAACIAALAVASPAGGAIIAVVLIIGEVAARLVARRGMTNPGALVRGVLDHGGELHCAEATFGFVLVPCADLVGRVVLQGEPDRVYRVRIDAAGCRRTASDNGQEGQPIVSVFGCSWTFGTALCDSDTYPWLLQDSHPRLTVKNYAVGGDSLYQMLLRLERSIATDRPVAVVIGYLPAHDLRNVGAMHLIPWFAGPSCRINTNSSLGSRLIRYPVRRAIRMVGWRHSYIVRAAGNLVNQIRAGGVGADVQRRTTEAVFLSIRDACQQAGSKLLVASLQLGNQHAEFLSQSGISWVGVPQDVTQPNSGGYPWLLLPYDNHPNEAANRMFAAVISEALDRLLRGESVSPSAEYLENNARTIKPTAAQLENTYPLY